MRSKKRSFHIHKKLRFRIFFYLIRIIFVVPIVFCDIFTKVLSIQFAVVGLVLGFIIGMILLKMYKFSWDEDSNKIIVDMEKFGFIFILFYALFIIFRNNLIGIFAQGAVVAAIGFSILAGITIGRLFGTRRKIILVLKEQGIL